MRIPHPLLPALLIAIAALSPVLQAQSVVTLTPAATPTSGQPGITSIILTGSGFPVGTIAPANTTVKLEPAAGGPAVTTLASAVALVTGSTRRVTFTIPASIVVATPTAYLASVSGTVTPSSGAATTTFASSNKSTLTINPAPGITTLSPNTGVNGQTLAVAITGVLTNFVQGSTQANFGAGISVGGAPEGAPGPVTVTSATTATAQLRINGGALGGPRAVTVATGVQQITLPSGFSVTFVPITITSLNVSPSSVPLGLATTVTATAAVTGHPDPGSVQLQRLDTSGRVLAVLGTFHDDGLNGDTRASDGVFTLQSSFTEFAASPVSLRASATSAGAVNHVLSPLASLTVTGTPAPTVTFSAPANSSYLNLSPTTVSGTVNPATATLVINAIPVTVAPNGSFSAQIPLAEGPNIVAATATATTGSAAAGTATLNITLDTTPPHVTITSPPAQFTTTDATISVAGNINDIVVGTVNDQQATVKINGTTAQVANRTFLAPNIPLAIGVNTLQAVGTDRAGNSATTQITVTRQAITPGLITLVSGNNQTAAIGAAVSAPLVVNLTDATGAPAANKAVIFNVIQNNGGLSTGGAAPAANFLVNTDSQGRAQANWTLGLRSGAGSDAVQAYAVGFSGTATFTATAAQGTPGKIVIDSGSNQTGSVNQPLPKPFIAIVVDAGNNRLAGVPVTFAVVSGGGNIGGQGAVTVTSDSDGRASATLTLGFQEGTSNNLVTADFPNDTAFPATFAASGRGPGNPANTTITGLVLDNSNQPVPGVTVRAVQTNVATSSSTGVQAAATVQTNSTGQFSISPAPVGLVKLLVDGATATVPGAFPTLDYDLVTVAGQNNSVGQPIYLLPIKTNNQLCVTPTTGGGTLTIPEAPGFSLTFGPGQVTFPGGSKSGCVSVTSVHPDKIPMSPGFGQQPRFIVTIQPSGALFSPPAPITLPNLEGLAPRAVTEMYSFDHDIGSFVAIGTGTVSDDGQVIRSNQGVGVLKAGWHCGGNTNPVGTAAYCPICFYCPGSLANCTPQGNNTPCGNGGMCQYGQGCVGGGGCGSGFTLTNGLCCPSGTTANCVPPQCPAGQVFDTTTNTCVNVGPCAPGYTINNGVCCQIGSTTQCVQPKCLTGQTFDPTTGACLNICPAGYTLFVGVCCQGASCVPPTCPPGQFLDPTGTCQTVLSTCTPQTAGRYCVGGGSTPGTCTVNSTTGLGQCSGTGNQCPSSCGGSSCTNGVCQCQLTSVTATANGGSTLVAAVGAAISFASLVQQANCGSLVYDWSFGDGTHSSSTSPSYAYAIAGVYSATLTVTCSGCTPVTSQLSITVASISLSSAAPAEQGKVNHYFCLVGSADVAVLATLTPGSAPASAVVWTGGTQGTDLARGKRIP